MRFHLVGLPHTQVTRQYDWCAYTAKLRRFAGMMHSLGHDVFVYAGVENVADCTEHVEVVHEADLIEWFGASHWPQQSVFQHWDSNHPSWRTMNARAISEIRSRIRPGDFVGLISGTCQAEIYHAFKDTHTVVEWGIGYSGTVADFRVFESYAWAHHVAGLQHSDQIRYFDTVIPNSYDDCEFRPRFDAGEYLLFMARPTPLKGMEIVREIAKRTDLPVVTAGQGQPWLEGADHRGVVLGREKADLLAGAAALLSPTTYLEPFGGVTIEAMLSGTPVITTDWGAFSETVINHTNGFRCRTLAQFMDATELAPSLDREAVRASATKYLTERVRFQYEDYFESLLSLGGEGWYAT